MWEEEGVRGGQRLIGRLQRRGKGEAFRLGFRKSVAGGETKETCMGLGARMS